MTFFIVFVFSAVLLGAGAMLSPAWRTAQPRIALSATLCLAIVVGGAVFYAKAFGWDTLVVDYLLFALLSGVVLGGTLSTAQARAEARGEQLADRDQGWPGSSRSGVLRTGSTGCPDSSILFTGAAGRSRSNQRLPQLDHARGRIIQHTCALFARDKRR